MLSLSLEKPHPFGLSAIFHGLLGADMRMADMVVGMAGTAAVCSLLLNIGPQSSQAAETDKIYIHLIFHLMQRPLIVDVTLVYRLHVGYEGSTSNISWL
jgi:hypothetical protein